ncbi:membrane lipoprotein lipid attachment site-containing protein [Providencia burhodogranariea]|uniref:Lipoprotein n=1 Tax=Providencia burhodogranariea DSM 19968 TaxID=1141662 RepID=K8WQ32_9GAMM|nr:membrane lipoprotein lipid attachment site-containing protein [Providencia burhodogranariea]EKT62718.1 hypothetical protein OOA_06386 [Providencia burhodogranariea DSM 19968]
MKRTLIAIVFAFVVTGCDNKSDAPFGLKWGQPVDSISFIKQDDCQKEADVMTCKFTNQEPFNPWSWSNELQFDRNGLAQIKISIVGTDGYSPSFDNFKDNLHDELKFLSENGFNKESIAKIEQRCEEEASCDGTSEMGQTNVGEANIWLTTFPSSATPVGIVTISKNNLN